MDGAEPGDVLEVKVLSIELAVDYGHNGCKGFLPEKCEPNAPLTILQLEEPVRDARAQAELTRKPRE